MTGCGGGWRVSDADLATGLEADPEQITASQVRCGDILVWEGRQIEITTRPRNGVYWFGAGRYEGLAIDWRAGTASGILFRRDDETVHRARKARAPHGAAGHEVTSHGR